MNPRKRLPFLMRGFAGKCAHLPDLEVDVPVGVAVFDIEEMFRGEDGDGQFFGEFARERFLYGLACVDLAAGKFPQSTLMEMIVAPAHEHLAACVGDHAHGHTEHGVRRCPAQLRYSALMRT